MPRYCITMLIASLTLPTVAAEPEPIVVTKADWPWWRGPNRNGIADPDQKPPLTWSATENIIWKVPVPGRGHGSPAIVSDRVYLAVADSQTQTQSLVCFDRRTGRQLWQTPVHRGNFAPNGNAKASHASSTPACDGKRVYINFLNDGAIHTTALDLDGRILWQTKVSDYVLHQGFGSSPALYHGLVLVSADNKGGGVIAGLDRTSGKLVWKQERPKAPNYCSPIVVTVAGKDQLVMIGCDLVVAFDPLTGTKLWETKGATTECVTSTATDGKHIFTSGGYPTNHVSAIAADGSAKSVWQNKSRVYVPSMLVHRGHLFAVLDEGVAACWVCENGTETWRGRLSGGFSSSPVLVGDRIYATNESGKTFVFRADPVNFEVLAQNQLGDEVMSTPAICGSRIYIRVAHKIGGTRQEMLYCLGTPD